MHRPHFSEIASHLREAISSGHFSVGDLLPTELALSAHYGTSRHTIRAALAQLQSQGLVSRRKNAGTRIEATHPRSAFRPSLESVDDLVQFGARHRRVIKNVTVVPVPSGVAGDLRCEPGARWLLIESLRLDGDTPLGWTAVYIDSAYAAIEEDLRQSPETLVCALIESRFGRRIAQIEQDVHADVVPQHLAIQLRAAAGSAALKVVRRYLDGEGEVFELSISIHPADRYWFSMRLGAAPG